MVRQRLWWRLRDAWVGMRTWRAIAARERHTHCGTCGTRLPDDGTGYGPGGRRYCSDDCAAQGLADWSW